MRKEGQERQGTERERESLLSEDDIRPEGEKGSKTVSKVTAAEIRGNCKWNIK